MNRLTPFILFVIALAFFFISERIAPRLEEQADTRQPVHIWCTSIPAQIIVEFTEQFEKLHPEYDVQVQTVAWNSLQEKTLWAVAASSNVPDLILGSSEWTGGLANSGALDPLDKYLPKEFFDQFFPSALGTYQYPLVERDKPGVRGEFRQYGIPLDLDMMMIFYRADAIDPVLKTMGLNHFPTDWVTFKQLGQKLYLPRNSNGQSQNMLYLDPEDPVPLRMAFLPASGGRMFSRDLETATFDSPEAIAAFSFMGELLRDNIAKEWTPTTQGDPMELIKSERIFANISGPWYCKMLEARVPEQSGKWRVAPFPKRKPEFPSTGLGGSCLAMPYNASNKKGAVMLAQFLASRDFALAYFNRVGSPPPIKYVWDSPEFQQPLPYFGGQKVYQVVRQVIDDSRPLQLLPNAQVMKQHVRWALAEICTRDAEATATLREAVSRANTALDKAE